MNNQQVLLSVIVALVLVIGILVLDRHRQPETFGEKLGHTIDRAADDLNDAVGGKK